MDKQDMDYTDSFTDVDWAVLLYLLLMQDIKNKNDTWNKFEHDLVYQNRFYSDSPIVEELRKRVDEATRIIQAKTVFFRARSFKHSSFEKLMRYYMKETGSTKEEIDAAIENLSETENQIQVLAQLYSEIDASSLPDKGESDALIAAQKKWKRNVRYKGYNADDSTAPKSDLIGNQRANPDHIRYLYLCEDEVTPIYEIRPIIGEQVSVAKFVLQKEIKVYDLTLDIQDHMTNPDYEWPSLYNTIGQMFSRPNNGDLLQYIPTQYLAEEIKRMGFDGLRFNSSLHKGGVNVVLFDPEICKAVSSELVDVAGIELKLDEPIIYKIGKAKQGQALDETKN